ncbi:MAG: isocitrate lyase family protein, partial [Mycobacteriaceae bacterium]|nr:isocitrate lyase family protein [Mycobacteriaceae bacterium]
MAIIEADAHVLTPFEQDVTATQRYFDSPRFEGIVRLYSARQVVEQRGTIPVDYTVAREAAEAFYPRLCELFANRQSITTFGPYSPGQAVTMKRMGIEGIYLGGWATSAKGSTSEDPGPDLASYPLSQVPDEAAGLVRALLTADRNQQYVRLRMTDEQRAANPAIDFRPFIIADADTGHGGDPHVRNLIRRFVEAGVPGYHIEDQRPGTKKCGHQGGKVLVPSDEQLKRLNAARFQLDVMGVPGIIVARTDAEAANLLDSRADERDQPFLLGATNLKVPSYKACFLAMMRRFYDLGVKELNGHLLYALPEGEYLAADAWLQRQGILDLVAEAVAAWQGGSDQSIDTLYDRVESRFVEAWEADAGLETYGDAVAELL